MHSNDLNFWIHHLHIDHNAPCLLPPPPHPPPQKNIGITIVANFSWVSQLSQEVKNNTNVNFFFFFFLGGGGGLKKGTLWSL